MSYKLTQSNMVIRLVDGAWIPANIDNVDFQNYQKWLANGGIPQSADPIPVIPVLSTKQKIEALGIDFDDLKAEMKKP